MTINKIVSYILYAVSLTAIFLASGIKQVINWWDIAKPFFLVWLVCLLAGLIIGNVDYIRRYSYPAIICTFAWLHKHKILKTKFSSHTYRVYKYYGKSYKKLFEVVQDAFDQYLLIKADL